MGLLETTKTPNSSIIELIDKTYLGSRGAQYKLLDAPNRIHHLDHPQFYFIRRHEKVLGNITFCNRNKSGVSENYIRYFAFDQSVQAGKPGQNQLKKKPNRFKSLFKDLFERDAFDIAENFCYYAFVDQKNWKSMEMGTQFGFQSIGFFETRSFSRLKPKKRLSIRKLDNWEQKKYLDLLSNQYKNYNFFHPVNIDKGEVYGYFENEELICAACFYPTSWKIKSLPGKKGKYKIQMISRLPLLNRFFPDQKLNFLGLEGLFCKNPERINQFLESVLELRSKNVIMIWSDVKCEVMQQITPFMKYGPLARLSKQELAHIIVKHNLNTDIYSSKPSYISAYDIS